MGDDVGSVDEEMLGPADGQMALKMLRGFRARLLKRASRTARAKQSLRMVREVGTDVLFPGIASKGINLVEYVYEYGGMPIDELAIVCQIVRYLEPRRLFEIGTFEGATTLQMAANCGADVYTLDLPPEDVEDRIDVDPELDVYPASPGKRFKSTTYAERITQLYGNSQTFEFARYFGMMDLVLVDGCHHYDFVRSDSQNALKMVSENGVILWHDYASYAPGVVQALEELGSEFNLARIGGTSIVVYGAGDGRSSRQTAVDEL